MTGRQVCVSEKIYLPDDLTLENLLPDIVWFYREIGRGAEFVHQPLKVHREAPIIEALLFEGFDELVNIRLRR